LPIPLTHTQGQAGYGPALGLVPFVQWLDIMMHPLGGMPTGIAWQVPPNDIPGPTAAERPPGRSITASSLWLTKTMAMRIWKKKIRFILTAMRLLRNVPPRT